MLQQISLQHVSQQSITVCGQFAGFFSVETGMGQCVCRWLGI